MLPYFLYTIKTGLAYFSDDIRNVEGILSDNKSKLLHKYLKTWIIPINMNLSILSDEDRALYILAIKKIPLEKINGFNEFEKLLYDNKKWLIYGDSFWMKLIHLISHPSKITLELLHDFESYHLSDSEKFIIEILYFHFFSFVNIDFKKSYFHLLRAEKIYNFFSQVYALKVRTLYFMCLEKAHKDNHINIRQKFKTNNSVLSEKILKNIELSNKYYPDNPGIITFQIALYLHTYNIQGVKLFLRNIVDIKEFHTGQIYAIYLWVWKYFMRRGNYKQSKYYLYTISEKIILIKRLDVDVIKARIHLSIYQNNEQEFRRIMSFLLNEKKYKKDTFQLQENSRYIAKSGMCLENIKDSYIVLPLTNLRYSDYFNFIAVDELKKNEKKFFPIALILFHL